LSDPEAGAGFWLHNEVVAPTAGDPYVHGWAAVFMASRAPVVQRFGPEPRALATHSGVPTTEALSFSRSALAGSAGTIEWDLALSKSAPSRPLYTFPAWAWRSEALPGAQVLPVATATASGTMWVEGERITLTDRARGNIAHIYGQGNAERWGWLHAELGGGDVLEVVAAVSRRRGLRKLRPLPFLQLRLNGRDWPRDPLPAAFLMRADPRLPSWTVSGTLGRYRIRAEVHIDPSRSVTLEYVDPDGDTATCTNSELCDAEVVLERRLATWELVSRWQLDSCAHAEVGTRP
jgi:hypothetical protein